MQVLGQGHPGADLVHAFIGMAEVFAQPQPGACFKPTAAQHPLHRFRPSALWIGEHRQGGRPFLQGAGEHVGIPAMQAHPAGVLPGAPDPGEGQLQRGRCRVKAESA